MLRGLAIAAVSGLVRLRYKVRVTGVDEVLAKGRTGILFLPNHVALVDPPILVTRLYRHFRPRPLADRDQVKKPVIHAFATLFNVFPMPDPLRYGNSAKAEVEQAINGCIAALKRGENILIYPSGRLARRNVEDLAGNSAIETILRGAPDVRVVLVRTKGLWGSSSSAASGRHPEMGRAVLKAVRSLLLSGIFFAPRRRVEVELQEPAELPRHAGRSVLNRYLEAFYNQSPPPNTYVPYTPWERGDTRILPEPAEAAATVGGGEIPTATRSQVTRHLCELTGRQSVADTDLLSRDLGFDSLAIVELATWVESEFGFLSGDGSGLISVRDLLDAACGQLVRADVTELKPIPPAWFRSHCGNERAAVGDGDTLADVFIHSMASGPERIVMADQLSGAKSWRDLATAALVLRPVIQAIPGPYVGVMFPASVAASTLYTAVLLAGKIPVMVNWTVGVRNIAHSLDLLGVQKVITADRVIRKLEQQAPDLKQLRDRFLLLEEAVKGISAWHKAGAWLRSRIGWRSALRPGAAAPSDTAVVLFTSGSESLPKAVPLTHANLLTNLRDLCGAFRFSREDRLLGMLPPFHSFGLSCTVLLPLCSGVRVVYHTNPTEGATLVRLIDAYRATLLVGTPTFLNGILRAATEKNLESLRIVISGAEKCPAQTYELLKRDHPRLSILEGYGITECSPVVSANDEAAPAPGTIGKVMASITYAVQDVESGLRARPGRPGLLLVRGPSIFNGYLNYDGPSPFVEFEGAKWYRTGDLVTEGPGGVLTFAGRLKRFVKLGGEMISLPAIEEVLNRHYATPADEEPVLAVEGTQAELNPELVLFTVRNLALDEVNRRIREGGLSALHNIRRIVHVDRIPALGTGKTDYRALRGLLAQNP